MFADTGIITIQNMLFTSMSRLIRLNLRMMKQTRGHNIPAGGKKKQVIIKTAPKL